MPGAPITSRSIAPCPRVTNRFVEMRDRLAEPVDLSELDAFCCPFVGPRRIAELPDEVHVSALEAADRLPVVAHCGEPGPGARASRHPGGEQGVQEGGLGRVHVSWYSSTRIAFQGGVTASFAQISPGFEDGAFVIDGVALHEVAHVAFEHRTGEPPQRAALPRRLSRPVLSRP